MLVLTRQKDERLVFTTAGGERIVVTVVEIRGDRVRIGCDADLSVTIHREELQDKIDGVKRAEPWKPLASRLVARKPKPGPQECVEEDDLRPYPETVVPPKKGDVL